MSCLALQSETPLEGVLLLGTIDGQAIMVYALILLPELTAL